MEEKDAEADIEQIQVNLIVHKLPESKQDTIEERIRDGSEIDLSMLTDALNLDVEIENMFHLGALSWDKEKYMPIWFIVPNMYIIRRVLESSKHLKNVKGVL